MLITRLVQVALVLSTGAIWVYVIRMLREELRR